MGAELNGALSAAGADVARTLFLLNGGNNTDIVVALALDKIAHLAKLGNGCVLKQGGNNLEFADRLCVFKHSLGFCVCNNARKLFNLFVLFLQLLHNARRPLKNVLCVCNLENRGGIGNELKVFIEKLQTVKTGNALNSAHACGNGGLGNNLEQAEVSGVFGVGTSAKLSGKVTDFNNADNIAVFF